MKLAPVIRLPIYRDPSLALRPDAEPEHPEAVFFFLKSGPAPNEGFFECGVGHGCAGCGSSAFLTLSGDIPDAVIEELHRHIPLCRGLERLRKATALPVRG